MIWRVAVWFFYWSSREKYVSSFSWFRISQSIQKKKLVAFDDTEKTSMINESGLKCSRYQIDSIFSFLSIVKICLLSLLDKVSVNFNQKSDKKWNTSDFRLSSTCSIEVYTGFHRILIQIWKRFILFARNLVLLSVYRENKSTISIKFIESVDCSFRVLNIEHNQ